MPEPFFVYILICSDGSYYVGQTDDLQRRIREHGEGGTCHYTSERRPVRLVWSTECQDRADAKALEGKIKKWSRAKKKALIRGDFEALQRAAKKDWAVYHQRRK